MAGRDAELAVIRRAAQDPANREAGADTGQQWGGTAALVRQPGTRLESPEETIQRAGNPWRAEGGPLTHETGAGLASRAHTALEAVSERLSHDGAELLATLLADRRDTRGVSVRRSADEVREGAGHDASTDSALSASILSSAPSRPA